jgi:hypothetical protein
MERSFSEISAPRVMASAAGGVSRALCASHTATPSLGRGHRVAWAPALRMKALASDSVSSPLAPPIRPPVAAPGKALRTPEPAPYCRQDGRRGVVEGHGARVAEECWLHLAVRRPSVRCRSGENDRRQGTGRPPSRHAWLIVIT